MSDRVTVSREDHLAIVSLSHPDRLNVLDREGWEALADIMTSLGEDHDVGCVVIEGSGSRAFSAGSDIGEFPEDRQTPEQVEAYARALEGGLSALRSCPHPTLALIHGVCVGGGLEIAACCDLRICSESSRFGAPINRLGLTMSYTELGPLVALVGASGALEVLLEGGLLHAERAYQKGFVNRVVPDEEGRGRGSGHRSAHRGGRSAREPMAQEIRAEAYGWSGPTFSGRATGGVRGVSDG